MVIIKPKGVINKVSEVLAVKDVDSGTVKTGNHNTTFSRITMNRDRSGITNYERLQSQIARLNRVGIALSSEHNLHKLLEQIVKEARSFTDADGGSLYIKETDKLHFLVAQTKSLEENSQIKPSFKSLYVPLTKESISGYVAITGQILNIPDVYHIPPTVEYRFNKEFDRKMGYRSKSVLTVPMKDHKDEIIGILQLVNAHDSDGHVVPFRKEYEALVHSLTSQAAVAIRNAKLIQEIKNLFRSLVRYSAKAIDSRSPHTAGHSGRVAQLSLRIAAAINEENEGPFANILFTPEELEELRMAGWLHDIGKIGVREAILEKASKLSESQMETVTERFAVIKASAMHHFLQKKCELLQTKEDVCDELEDLEQEVNKTSDTVDEYLVFLQRINIPGYLKEEEQEQLRMIAEKTFIDVNGEKRYYLTASEYENLVVIRGNLTPAEYREIQRHVDHTMAILRKIPFTKDLENIPEYAAAHHELLDGSGYPKGLKGEEIPLQGRILCISDIFDALSSKDRPYKKAVPIEQSLKILQEEAERGKLDADIVALFIRKNLYKKQRSFEEEDD